MSLGQIYGNHFTLVLRYAIHLLRITIAKNYFRCVMLPPDEKEEEGKGWSLEHRIDTIAQSLRDNGFVNYFGMQRFGVSSPGSHQIGRYMYVYMYSNT